MVKYGGEGWRGETEEENITERSSSKNRQYKLQFGKRYKFTNVH